MSSAAILLPVFVQVGLTFYLGFRLAILHRSAVLRGDVRLKEIALGRNPWPDHIEQNGNAYKNQFELPVAFYALVAFAMITRTADLPFVGLEWLLVGSRVAHAVVHTTSNHVPTRFRLFVPGAVVLLVMWTLFVIRILAGVA
jgi:hypothetical protein